MGIMKKVVNCWKVILLIGWLGILSLFLIVGPLLFGLLVDSHLFLLYIFTLVSIVPIGYLWYLLPDLIYELLNEDKLTEEEFNLLKEELDNDK